MKKIIYSLTLGIVIIDQFIKYLITKNFLLSETLDVIPNFFYLTYVKNTGGAWSIFENIPYLLVIVSAAFIIGINYYISKSDSFTKLETITYGMLLGGVFGNFIDRLLVSGVIDYLGFQFGNYYFPIFNFADIMIVLGIGLMIIDTLRGDLHEYRSRNK